MTARHKANPHGRSAAGDLPRRGQNAVPEKLPVEKAAAAKPARKRKPKEKAEK